MRKLSPQSIFSHYAIFSFDYAISNEQTRTETQTKGRRGKGRNKRIRRPNGVSISVMTARFVVVHRETEWMLITGRETL